MNAFFKTATRIAVALIALAVGACATTDQIKTMDDSTARPAAIASGVSLSSVTLGNAIDDDKRVAVPTDTFGVNDTIYASIATNGSSASSTITVKWTYQDGQTVNERTQTIAPTDAAVTEFHIEKPDDWPLGNYSVATRIHGKLVDTRKFTVK